VFPVAHQRARLVVNGKPHGDGAGGAPFLDLAHLQHRIERVAAIDRLQEARRLLEEGDQRIADDVRKDAGARRALDGDLQAMCQQIAMAARLAVLAVVVWVRELM
jgi:hypothetical protein